MKALLLSTVDTQPGAARAAHQLHRGLNAHGIDTRMLVQAKLGDDPTVLGPVSKLEKGAAAIRPALDVLPVSLYRERERVGGGFSTQWQPDRLAAHAAAFDPDVVNLHFVTEGFLAVETLPRFHKPLVWTLHDMWPFTGGCHYAQECEGFHASCGRCPQLRSRHEGDLSRRNMRRKQRSWRGVDLTVVTPSRWMAAQARAGSLFRERPIQVIPVGLDLGRFPRVSRRAAREVLGLSPDVPVALFGSVGATSDPRKGYHLLLPALKTIADAGRLPGLELMVFGGSGWEESAGCGYKSHNYGKIQDDITLTLVYAAADVFIAPSLQDNFPVTVIEANACGTPCVAFDIGGMPDMVTHRETGYLADPFDVGDLAHGIEWVLTDKERHAALGAQARRKVEREFTMDIQVRRYASLFEEIVQRR